MATDALTAGDLDYLQRVEFEPPPIHTGTTFTQAPPELRALVRVAGIGCLSKANPSPTGEHSTPITRDLLVSLSNYKIPLAFLVGGEPGQISIRIGTWLPSSGIPDTVAYDQRLLETVLATLYPAIDLVPDLPHSSDWPLGGLAMGIPTPQPPDTADGARQIDRLVRALRRDRWAALVLAQPADDSLVHDLRLRLINKMRTVQTAAKLGGVPSPLADHYLALLGLHLEELTDGQGIGAWRTAVYLLGDHESYPALASLWRGIFSGERSLPEPLRVWDQDFVPKLASSWAMPDPIDKVTAPGLYQHPFDHQTLLTSSQLAAYVHFPDWETNGFTITEVPDLDTVPPPADRDALVLGTVVERQQPTSTIYGIRPEHLTRHAAVAGVTGSGKTNTVFHLLRQIADRGIPFFVLEPAKTEYRALVHDAQLGPRLQVYTLGDEMVSPFRFNPFEVPEGIPVAVHLDLLRSVFNVSFGMWTPLPQILETGLHAIYRDRGWEVTTGTNRRLDLAADRAMAFPTLTDLVRKVEEIIPHLGYEPQVTGDLRAALRTRLNSLRTGGKGRMLDVRRSLPIELLLEQPTVLELEGMGDDEDKAFMMGLLMIRLAEHRRTQGDTETLRNLLVIEEAHRLLANAPAQRGQEQADARGKAVETFVNLLSEIRAYGQGVVVVDQIPTKLAPEVLKNTNLKLAHRIVAADDRAALATAMAMTPRQSTVLATLPTGRAAVFTDGDDAPLLLAVPSSKGGSGTWPSDQEIHDHMAHLAQDAYPEVFLPSADCDERCRAAPEACEAARALVDEPRTMRSLSHVVLSAVQTREGLERTWPNVLAITEASRPSWLDAEEFLACLVRHGAWRLADLRGARAGWSYTRTAATAELIDRTLTALLHSEETTDQVLDLRALLLELQGSGYGPFPDCPRIWGNRPGPCLCAQPVAELVNSGAFHGDWEEARKADRASPDGGWAGVWDVCQDAAYHLTEYPAEGQDPGLVAHLKDIADRTALCFAEQMLYDEQWSHPATVRRAVSALLALTGCDRAPERGQNG
ncbi:DUF87 domain-containing protein [Streptomyces sp. NPDC020096]